MLILSPILILFFILPDRTPSDRGELHLLYYRAVTFTMLETPTLPLAS